VQTESRATMRVQAFAQQVSDALLRKALDMDANEEARHKVVLTKLTEAYGISLAPEPHTPPRKMRSGPGWLPAYPNALTAFLPLASSKWRAARASSPRSSSKRSSRSFRRRLGTSCFS